MSRVRRIAGVMLVAAGIIGMLFGLVGIIGIWVIRPVVLSSLSSFLDAAVTSVETSRQAVDFTGAALDSTLEGLQSVSGLVNSLETGVENTRPAVETVNGLLTDTLPESIQSAKISLQTARDAAVTLEGAAKQLDSLQASLDSIPLVNTLLPDAGQVSEPEKPLSESLGELSAGLEVLPSSFENVSDDLDKTAASLKILQQNLDTVSKNVDGLSASLKVYKGKLSESRFAMDSLQDTLVNTRANLDMVVNSAVVLLSILLFCLLASQIVVINEGRRFLEPDGRHEGYL